MRSDIEPRHDRVLIRRIEERHLILLTDREKSIKGKILAVGPECVVKPGQLVLFNAKWNDLAHAELKATGSDVKSKTSPLERPLSYKFDPMLHLVTEKDIFAVLH